jgi:hypothetical protein
MVGARQATPQDEDVAAHARIDCWVRGSRHRPANGSRINEPRQDAAKDLMHWDRILTQTTIDKNKLHALDPPEVE